MFRITRDPSSGSFIQFLAKITVISIVSVDMDVVGVMAAYLPLVQIYCNFSQALYKPP